MKQLINKGNNTLYSDILKKYNYIIIKEQAEEPYKQRYILIVELLKNNKVKSIIKIDNYSLEYFDNNIKNGNYVIEDITIKLKKEDIEKLKSIKKEYEDREQKVINFFKSL
jgi:uncharacterized protein YutD